MKSLMTHILYKQFVAWNCNGCSIAPLIDYIHNPIYKELPEETAYFTASHERIYLDLRGSMGYTDKMKKLARNDSK